MKSGLLLVACMVTLLACEESPHDSPATTAQSTVAEADLVVSSDFSEEAEKLITPTNYKAELDAIEKEIGAP